MKLNEFKAWFDGYTESMEGAPSKKQWERIKEQIAAVDGVAITPYSYPIYIDRYVRPLYPYWAYGVGNITSQVGSAAQCQNTADYMTAINSAGQDTAQYTHTLNNAPQSQFVGVAAMYAAGKAESKH